MKKQLLILLSFLCFAICINAQDNADARQVAEQSLSKSKDIISTAQKEDDAEKKSNWKISGILSLNTSASYLVNWVAGGNNTVNAVAAANVSFLYKNNNVAWDSNIDTDYGIAYLSDNNFPWRKTNDKLNISTKFGWEFAKTWYLTALGSFKTQYAYGFDYGTDTKKLSSMFMAPSYTDLSVGIDWKPNDIFSLYLSPVAGRITTAITDSIDLKLKYAVMTQEDIDNGINKNFRAEFGASFKGSINYTRIENFKILTTVSLFTPYTKDFGKVDVDWDFSISYQFLKVLNVSLGTSLKYYNSVLIPDKDGNNPKARVQFKSILGLGIGYSF